MARFDPNAYPDRLAFEANARRVRATEIEKAFVAAAAWLEARQCELTNRLGRFVTAISAHSQRHSTH